jgi:DNA-binding NarL/FixJ family response regulator
MRVLVVDDVSAVRTRLVALLGEVDGIDSIDEASDADEALAVASHAPPEVVVLDLHLRGSSGLVLLPLLKAAHAETRIIVLTNDASDLHRRECVANGADFFFDKSRDFGRIVDVVGEMTHAKRARR